MNNEINTPAAKKLIGFRQKNVFGDEFFSNLNANTFIHMSANNLYKREFSNSLFEDAHLYVIVGTDSGLLPHYIESQNVLKGSRYVFIEPKNILDELKSEGVINTKNEQIAYADEETWVNELERFNLNDYFYINGVRSINAFCANENALESYAELSWNVVERLKQLQFQHNASIAKKSFIIEQLLNLANNYTPISRLKNKFLGKTAFVLGGGTSLDESLPWLIENRKNIVLIVASRITKRLIEYGLKPDIVCSVDPYHSNWVVSKEIFLLGLDTVLVHSYHLYNPLLNQWQGRSFYCGKRVPWESDFNVENIDTPGPTVTNSAVDVAVYLGFSSIYLSGVDYCFSLDGFTHAQGSYEAAAGARFNLTGIVLETYEGTYAPTGLDYSFARESLEAQIEVYSKTYQTKFYNVAKNAAKVKGVPYCPIDTIKLNNDGGEISSILNSLFINENRGVFLTKALKTLNQATHQLKEISKLTTEALNLNEILYKEGKIENYKDKIHLDKIEQKLNKQHKKLSPIVKKFGLREFLQIITPFGDITHLTAEDVKAHLRVYYQSYINGSKELIELIERAKIHLLAHLEEYKSEPDWDLLVDYCHKEKCFGRVRIWRQLKAAQHLNPKQEQAFNELERLFLEELNNTPPTILDDFRQGSSLLFLKHRAHILFKHQQKDLLEHLLFALDKHYDPEGVIPYRYLLQGYLAELDKENEKAAEWYSKIFELGEGPIEEALLRVVSLNIEGQEDLGHQALGCLAQMKDQYLLFYADSLRIRGEIMEAIDAYIQYIEKFPQDLLAQIKLARLYISHNIKEGAHLMLDMILEKEPDNETALRMKEELR